MKDIYEFTDDELELIDSVLRNDINNLIEFQPLNNADPIVEYVAHKLKSLNHISEKIEMIRTFRQGNIDIDANIATELDGE